MEATPKTVRTSTNNLKVGDVVVSGNANHGFRFTTIVEIDRERSKNRIWVSEKYAHGGIGGLSYGKNAIWSVLVGA